MDKARGWSLNRPSLPLPKCGLKDAPQDQFSKLAIQDQISELPLQDRISKLPDDLLVAILNFLTLKEAAVTSAISRRWVHLWKSSHWLNFNFDPAKVLDLQYKGIDDPLLHDGRTRFVEMVNQVLQVNQSSEIEEFLISFPLAKGNEQDVDNWLKFAFERGVKRLELDLREQAGNAELYTFQDKLLLAQSCCGIPSSKFLDFMPLRTLSLKSLHANDETLKLILSKCTLLEHLVLDSVQDLKHLEVSGQSFMLRSLEISFCNWLRSVKISDINLVSFKYVVSVNECMPKLRFQNVPSLIEACYGELISLRDAFPALSCILPNLQKLTLVFNQIMEEDVIRWRRTNIDEFPKLPGVKELMIVIVVVEDHIIWRLASLIHAFPCLEKCVIQLFWGCPTTTEKASEIPFCPHECLKVVEFGGYLGRPSDLDLAMYFLKNGVALEELIIDPNEHNDDLGFTYTCPFRDKKVKQAATAQVLAKQQFENIIIPPHIKLKIL